MEAPRSYQNRSFVTVVSQQTQSHDQIQPPDFRAWKALTPESMWVLSQYLASVLGDRIKAVVGLDARGGRVGRSCGAYVDDSGERRTT